MLEQEDHREKERKGGNSEEGKNGRIGESATIGLQMLPGRMMEKVLKS